MISKPPKPCPALDLIITKARAAFNAMTPEAQEAMLQAQRKSWVRGEMAMGSDADEARERQALRDKKA